MKKQYILLGIVLLSTATTSGQDWVSSSAGDGHYNCDVVKSLDLQFGDGVYVRLNDTKYTVREFLALTVPACSAESVATAVTSEESFTITVENAVNLREFAGTNCVQIGVAQPGETFEVIGEDADWYEISYESASAFIAGWLTTRVADPPPGLLTDFQFVSEDTSVLLYGSTPRTGTWRLNLKREDDTNTDIQIQSMG